MRRMVLIVCVLALLPHPSFAQDKKRPEVLTPGKTGVWSLAFSPDGKTFASASVGRQPINDLKLWDWQTGQLKTSFSGHTDHIFCVTFSPDGKTLATTSQDKTVRLWDVAAGKEKAIIIRDLAAPKSVRFSADGKTLGVVSHKWVRLLDAATFKEKIAFEIHPTGGGHCFNPTLELMAYAPDAWYIHLVDTSTSKTKTLLTGLKGYTRSMTFSDDGKWLASCGGDSTLRIWDVTAGKLKASFAVEQGRRVALSKDGKKVAVGTDLHGVRVWDLTTNKELPSLHEKDSGPINSVAFSPDGTTLLAGTIGKIRLWPLDAK